jgi:hypothetical protein
MENAVHWEYKTLKYPARGGFLGGNFDESVLNTRMNELGEQRWELVTAFATHQGYGSSRDVVAIFKRARI